MLTSINTTQQLINEIHTCRYEWNKYNQTHYDGDNPPPKTVQVGGVCGVGWPGGPAHALCAPESRQTHNDSLPPSPLCQGYKFNIFYPDLLDKTQVRRWLWGRWAQQRAAAGARSCQPGAWTPPHRPASTAQAPTYKVERDPSSADGATCILRFTAGPPYEDLAFRIINKEWCAAPRGALLTRVPRRPAGGDACQGGGAQGNQQLARRLSVPQGVQPQARLQVHL